MLRDVSTPTADPSSVPPTLAIVVAVDEPGSVVTLSGRLLTTTVAEVRNALTAAVARGSGDLVVDISGVELVDASGLGVLVGAHRLAQRADRRLVLRGVPVRIERLLAVTRLNRVLASERTLAV
jgi:anti-sigma B factor antagonist